MTIYEVIKAADGDNPNANTRVMVNLAELKRLREYAESQVAALTASLASMTKERDAWQYEVTSARNRAAESEARCQRALKHTAEDHAEMAELRKRMGETFDALGDYFNGIGVDYEWIHPTEPSFFSWLEDEKARLLAGSEHDKPHCVACTHSGPCVGQCSPCRTASPPSPAPVESRPCETCARTGYALDLATNCGYDCPDCDGPAAESKPKPGENK